jgi:putative ATPase
MAPKSNSLYKAIGEVKRVIAETGNLEVPLEIRNAPTKLMKQWGYGKGYKYAHDYEGAVVNQQHLPDQLVGKRFYFPVDSGVEAKIKEKLDKKLRPN